MFVLLSTERGHEGDFHNCARDSVFNRHTKHPVSPQPFAEFVLISVIHQGFPDTVFIWAVWKPSSCIRPSPVPADGTPKCAAATASLTPLPAAAKGVLLFSPLPGSSLVLLIMFKYRGQLRSSHLRAIKLPSAQLPEEVTVSCCT